MKKLICVMLLSLLIIMTNNFSIACFAEEINSNINVSLDDKFANNRIIVVFDNETSLQFKKYSTSDFDTIQCKSIYDFTDSIEESIESAINNIASHVLDDELLLLYDGISLGEYNQVICIELDTSNKKDVVKAVNKLRKQNGVLYAIPDYEISVSSTIEINDEYYNSTHNPMKDIAQSIDLEKAWNICTGLPNNYSEENAIRVAVLDTGIDKDHPDLAGNINCELSCDFTGTADIDGELDPSLYDDHGHGTMCAGIIGAEGNSIGFPGVCWNIELVSLKVMNEYGKGYTSYVANAIQYAYNKVDVLNMSFSYTSLNEQTFVKYYLSSFEQILSNFDGVAVCSAGNNSYNIDNPFSETPEEFYPAQYSSNKLIVVGASEGNNILAQSNVGNDTVDLFAPGSNIYSTYPTHYCSGGSHHNKDESVCQYPDYHSNSGTSFAAPYVTGTVALMLCINKDLNESTIKKALIDSVDQKSAYSNKCVSGGRLNVFNALMEIVDHSLHDKDYTKTDTTHTLHCYDCDYHASAEPHEFYINSVSSSGTVVGCLGCDYTLNCDDQPSYINNGNTGHRVECSCACYSFYEEHDNTYTKIMNNLYYHNVSCLNCEYIYQESHAWELISGVYRCSYCGITASYVPDIMSLPDPELKAYLASLSDDKLAEFIASLPEDQAARVTALLPSDDELLTE